MSFMEITSKPIKNEVICNTSKSHSNRVLVACALCDESKEIVNLSDAQDVLDMLSNLRSLGLEIKKNDNVHSIANSFPACEVSSSHPVILGGSEGGTTIRFLLPLIALGKNEYHLKLKGSLVNRPMKDLIDNLTSLGAKIYQENDTLKIKGPISLANVIKVNCAQTTQFASAMMLLQIHREFELKLENLSFSQTYLEMTTDVIKSVKENKRIEIQPDFSSLGYFIAYGLTQSSLKITNVKSIDQNQADAYFFTLMNELNINYQLESDGLFIPKSDFAGFEVDSSKCIDLVPTLMYLASFAKTESLFTHLEPLKFKESDRLNEMLKTLSFFGVKFDYNKSFDSLTIYPSAKSPGQKDLSVANDHRMVMVASLFFKILGGGRISPAEAVSKSFPSFFDYFK